MRNNSFQFCLVVLVLLLFYCCKKISTSGSIDFTGQVDTITDIEGNKYKTIGIGSQIWMAQNLRATRLNDGTNIPKILDDTLWSRVTTPAICWYDNDSVRYQNMYSPLYNFYCVNTGHLCPIGWHIPGKLDWEILASFLGGDNLAGGKLKEQNGIHWTEPNLCYQNSYGFKALPGGCRKQYNGEFIGMGELGFWWTSTADDVFIAECFAMSYDNTQLIRIKANKREGYSIRCIKE